VVRDLDVQMERVEQWMDDVPAEDRKALGDLRRLLSHQRDDARRRLLAALESTRYERLVSGLTTLLRQGPSRRSAPARAPAVVVVPDLLRVRQRAVTKAAKRARHSNAADDFHKLRIRGKRLRYALEFVSEIYGSHTAKYVRHLVRMQDTLGLMQDARVAAERLHALVVERGDVLSHLTVFVVGGVAERYRQESARLARRVPKRMKKVGGARWDQLAGYFERRRVEAAPHFAWGAAGPTPATEPVPPTPAVAPGSNGRSSDLSTEDGTPAL
jgi:CHAD domain-containing protein